MAAASCSSLLSSSPLSSPPHFTKVHPLCSSHLLPRRLFLASPFSNPHILPLPLPSSSRLDSDPTPKRRLLAAPARAGNNKNNDSAELPDRLIAAFCYLYPFLDGAQYGRYVLAQFPPFALLLQPLFPAIRLFKAFPLNSLVAFFALYFAVVRNPSAFNRYVRFNTMQAIALDVLLIFPDVIERTFDAKEGLGLEIMMSLDSTVFLFLFVCLIYGSGSCLLGQLPRLPIVAEAADMQVF